MEGHVKKSKRTTEEKKPHNFSNKTFLEAKIGI
jgi:hypothetical protein